ncbi:hypothetical protein TNCV_1391 [Trichonephila clavipes]|nr:hypothetical protein TNCV_1391 [Trichonephila clavipes]
MQDVPRILVQTIRGGRGLHNDSEDIETSSAHAHKRFRSALNGNVQKSINGYKPKLTQSYKLSSPAEEYRTVLRKPSWQICIWFTDLQKEMHEQQKDCSTKGILRDSPFRRMFTNLQHNLCEHGSL